MTSLEFTSQVQKISLTLRPAAMNLTRDADDAKDLVQETLLKALLNKDKFKAGTNLKAWLYTIMRNTFINNYNKITKRSSNIDSTEYFQYFNTDQNYITHNGATSDFVVRDINEAIASLGTDYRTPFMMYYIGYKYMEIAEKLQIPIGTVKNRIHIARKELKSALQVYAPVGASAATEAAESLDDLGACARAITAGLAAALAARGRRFLFNFLCFLCSPYFLPSLSAATTAAITFTAATNAAIAAAKTAPAGSSRHAVVIGAGFAGLAAATTLAQAGWRVTVLEKNEGPGGRARVFRAKGFTFDMGPSWYWMPDVFEKYFARFGKKVADYYELQRLDPSYQVVFRGPEAVDIPAKMSELRALFESYESGSAARLDEFLKQAAYKYEVGINRLVYAPSRSVFEFADPKLLVDMVRMDVLQSMHKHVRRFFKDPRLLELVEFPILFLGATSENTPALYSLMNYADLALGTWYPKGGMHKIVEGMVRLAKETGVQIHYNEEVTEIVVENGRSTGVCTANGFFAADAVVAGADYHHIEQEVLRPEYRHYDEKYWNSRTMAPSSLLFYLGVNKKLDKLRHHNLFFDEDLNQHAREIYEQPQWPTKPLYYASVPSKTDPTVAPEGQENLFLLIPVAPGLPDDEATRERYYNLLMDRLEKHCGHSIRDAVVFKRSYAHRDFMADYHSFKGNAYGLANTLKQTAILKPTLKSKKVSNLYFTGQLTVPGPGVPPSLISGQVVAGEVLKEIKNEE